MWTRTFRIGRLAGIDIVVHWSIVLLFVFAVSGRDPLSRFIPAICVLTVLLTCVIAHELGHALMARRYGVPTQRIMLWPLGGFAVFRHPPPTPWSDLVISVAGPLANLALAGLAFTLQFVFDMVFGLGWANHANWPIDPWYVAYAIRFFLNFNLILGLTNLLPIYPLDGGHVLRSIFEMLIGRQKADTIMFVVSIPLAVAVGLIGVLFLEDYSTALVALLIVLVACLLDPRLNRYINSGWAAVFNRGDYFFYRSDYPKAIAAYDAILRRHPNNTRTYHKRGAAYANLGKHEIALADYTQVLQREPQNFKAYFDRSASYLYLKKYFQAIADYDQSIALNQTYMPAYHNRGFAHTYVEQYEKAIADFDHVLATDPTQGRAMADRAWARFCQGDADQIIDAEFDQAVALQPDSADILNLRGYVAGLKRFYNIANADFERAAELDPTHSSILYNVGLARLFRGEPATALVTFKTLTQQRPGSPLGYLGSGFVYHQCRDFKSAIAAFDAALHADPINADSLLFRSMSRFACHDIDRATADLRLAVEYDAKAVLLQIDPILEHLFRGEMLWARSILAPLTLRKDHVGTLSSVTCGDIAYWNSLYEEAIEQYTQAIRSDEKCVEAFMGRARAFIAQNQHSAAQPDLTQVVILKKASRLGREAINLLAGIHR